MGGKENMKQNNNNNNHKSFIQVKEKKIENIASAMSMVSQFMDRP